MILPLEGEKRLGSMLNPFPTLNRSPTEKIENIVTKVEIVQNKQFLLLSLHFQKKYAAEASESVCIWERANGSA